MRNGVFVVMLSLCTVLLASYGCKKKGEDVFFRTLSIELKNMDNAGEVPVSSTQPIPLEAYVIRINYESEIVSGNPDAPHAWFVNEDVLEDVSITCAQSFFGRTSGTALNDLFIPGMSTSLTMEDFGGAFGTQAHSASHSELWLMEHGASPGTYKFIVTVRMESGAIFSDTTSNVVLQ